MAEKLIYLEGVDPVDFYGVNNVRFNKFIELYPDLKIVSRGNEIRVTGEKKRLEDFEDKPIVVRSSSLLEDRLGSPFVDKYRSIFLGNQGECVEVSDL